MKLRTRVVNKILLFGLDKKVELQKAKPLVIGKSNEKSLRHETPSYEKQTEAFKLHLKANQYLSPRPISNTLSLQIPQSNIWNSNSQEKKEKLAIIMKVQRSSSVNNIENLRKKSKADSKKNSFSKNRENYLRFLQYKEVLIKRDRMQPQQHKNKRINRLLLHSESISEDVELLYDENEESDKEVVSHSGYATPCATLNNKFKGNKKQNLLSKLSPQVKGGTFDFDSVCGGGVVNACHNTGKKEKSQIMKQTSKSAHKQRYLLKFVNSSQKKTREDKHATLQESIRQPLDKVDNSLISSPRFEDKEYTPRVIQTESK